ncbi:hypothetical protein K503DRAFT_863698 [Rhizopogon vinicolor AM-OR11-026]|uniref:F-box domain-containing protein n=1 Tax=Rhizopogon vinicolor AM-OR11-026 TaxID=1314800 RepID=A0A1B7N9U0_9AGAM|nr:hypothetical protein K503DRAFT_863698 [Rhizopogon vinicolor AM-OR11-026]
MGVLHDLPVEVWRQILALLIRSPSVLLSDREDPFSEVRDIDIFMNKDVKTQSALRLVCKDWHEVVTELAYEHLRLTSMEEVTAVANHLEESQGHPRNIALGTCILRIDLTLRDPTDQYSKALVRILRCTPNLEILVTSNVYVAMHPNSHLISPQGQTPTEIIDVLVKTCSRSLRRVEWTSNEYPSWTDLMRVLRSATGIKSLTLANIYGSLTEKPHQRLILPSLKTLVLGDSPSFSHASLGNVPLNALLTMLAKSPEQLPSLERLEGFSPFSPDFLRTHGSKVRIVRTVAFTPLLHEIIATCPNLHTFITIFPHHILDLLSHPSLKRIGIFPISEDPVGVPQAIFSAYIMKPLEDLMCQIDESRLPKLAQVRIRNVGTLANIMEHPEFLQRWWKRWHLRDVRFDDKDGRPFHLSSQDDDVLVEPQ